MKYRKLRIVWSVACGVALLLLVALWIRSYRYVDLLATQTKWQSFQISSVMGRLKFYHLDVRRLNPLLSQQAAQNIVSDVMPQQTLTSRVLTNRRASQELKVSSLEFKRFPDANPKPMARHLFVPNWFPTVLLVAFAAIPWIGLRQFSLRTMLIAMTVVGVALGWIVYAIR